MNFFDDAQILFQERFDEVERFIETTTSYISMLPSDNDSLVPREQEHILKSNILLMQYNILESSVLELYKCLYNYLKTCEISIDSLNKHFSYNVFTLIKRATQSKHNNIRQKLLSQNANQNFSKCAMNICFDLDDEEKKFLVNGNIDGKKVKEFLESFGIDISQLNELDLRNLKTIKDNRQLLAHGSSSFSAVGKDIGWDTLNSNQVTIKALFETSKFLLNSFCDELSQITDIAS